MGLDIRLPIGMMFSLLGAMMALYGLATSGDADLYRSSLGINVNLWWGGVLFCFGAVMLFLALRGRSRRKVSGEKP
jgi:hypothetical protein